MKKIVISLILPMTLLSTQAFGKTATLICNGCDRAEKRTLALEGGTGDYFIFDLVNRGLVHWSVNGYNAQTIALSSDQSAVYQATQNFYDTVGALDVGGEESISVEIPGTLSQPTMQRLTADVNSETAGNNKATAFDVVSTPIVRDQALSQLDQLNTLQGFANAFRGALASILHFASSIKVGGLGVTIPVNIQTRVWMTGGSSFIAKWDFDTTSYVYVKGSAKDAVGNPIPEDAISAAGGPNSTQIYNYPPTDQGRESLRLSLRRLTQLGIYSDSTSFLDINYRYTIACTNIGGPTKCTIL